jgi:hypothetical protein
MSEEVKVMNAEESPAKERREVAVCISENRILDILGFIRRPPSGYIGIPDFPELPEGSRVRAVYHDFWSRCFVVLVEHQSFEIVPEGMRCPEWPGPLAMTMRAVKIAE